ncbi:MAG: sigma factor [Acidithiobacillus sp.]|nr:sigma factor [Acidithiobacillus sp.]
MANAPLTWATILADEVIAARSSSDVLLELLQRADPFLYRLAEKHHRYHPWDEVEDIHQEHRETFIRCIDKYDVSRSFEGRGFIIFLSWQMRTDYRSHYRRLDAEFSVREMDMDTDNMAGFCADMEPYLQKALRFLSPEDRKIFLCYLNGENYPHRIMARIQRELRCFMLGEEES